MMLQVGGAIPTSAWELVLTSSTETKVVLVVIGVFSVVSWFIIALKWWQFRRLNRQANRFFERMEDSTRLDQAYQAVMKQPPSPYNRLFREAINFYNELRPGVLQNATAGTHEMLSPTQLEAFKMVLGKRMMGTGLPWSISKSIGRSTKWSARRGRSAVAGHRRWSEISRSSRSNLPQLTVKSAPFARNAPTLRRRCAGP